MQRGRGARGMRSSVAAAAQQLSAVDEGRTEEMHGA